MMPRVGCTNIPKYVHLIPFIGGRGVVVGSITIIESPPGTPVAFTNDLYNSDSVRYQTLKAEVEAWVRDMYRVRSQKV